MWELALTKPRIEKRKPLELCLRCNSECMAMNAMSENRIVLF